jgi:FlaA1/EpsC-like NDP-sugar epimerase
MKVLDVAQAVAPNCQIEYIGIRPGEKLHEGLLSDDEARNSVETEENVCDSVGALFAAERNTEHRVQ